MTVQGVDYSFGRPNVAALAAGGIAFACRYLSSNGAPGYHNDKDLTSGEAQALHNAGLSIVLNYESTAQFMLGGYNTGVSTARWARAQASALGAPASAVIYYSADLDADAAQTVSVLDFLHGAADAEGSKGPVGVYGGLRVVKAALDAGFWGWQTFAWSQGVWDERAHIRQTAVDHDLAGAQVDLDEARAGQYGQWAPPGAPMSVPASLREGSTGSRVARLQRTLAMAGYTPGPIDAVYGPRTTLAVRRYQAAHMAQVLWDDGVCGAHTWTALIAWVVTVQGALLTAGFAPGPLDGDPGVLTLGAVKRFQQAKGLVVDGIVGPRTSAALHI